MYAYMNNRCSCLLPVHIETSKQIANTATSIKITSTLQHTHHNTTKPQHQITVQAVKNIAHLPSLDLVTIAQPNPHKRPKSKSTPGENQTKMPLIDLIIAYRHYTSLPTPCSSPPSSPIPTFSLSPPSSLSPSTHSYPSEKPPSYTSSTSERRRSSNSRSNYNYNYKSSMGSEEKFTTYGTLSPDVPRARENGGKCNHQLEKSGTHLRVKG